MYSALSTFSTIEQGTEPPTAPRALQHWLSTAPGVCSWCVCVHLDGLNAEHKFRVWVCVCHTHTLGHMPLHFHHSMFLIVKYIFTPIEITPNSHALVVFVTFTL